MINHSLTSHTQRVRCFLLFELGILIVMTIAIVFQLVVLLFSIIIHEVSHGAMALYLGDETAKRLGRLTLNPLKHIDPIGSLLLPLILFLAGSRVIFGWAKPVPYNPYNLPNPRRGAALIGAAGPVSNLILAIIFALLLHLPLTWNVGGEVLVAAFGLIVLLNLLLAFFNLVPIPPLDGSKLLFALFPNLSFKAQRFLEIYGFFILLIFLFLGGLNFIWSVISVVFDLLMAVVGVDAEAVLGAINLTF